MSHSSTTARLALPLFATTDSFDHADYDSAFNTLDEYPGLFVCTSTTHPSWGTAQVGMSIFESDTGRILWWNGSAFKVPGGNVVGYGNRLLNINQNVHQSSTTVSVTYTFPGALVLPANCDVLFFMNASTIQDTGSVLDYSVRTTVNSTTVNSGYPPWHSVAPAPPGDYDQSVAIDLYSGGSSGSSNTLGVQVNLSGIHYTSGNILQVRWAWLYFIVFDRTNGQM